MNIDKIYKYVNKITDTYHKKKVEYFDDGNYFGQIKNGQMHGEGFLCYTDNLHSNSIFRGANYVGGFRKCIPHSKQGLFTFKDGTEYIGEIKDGMWHGQGTIRWTNDDRYVGKWNKNKEIGKGVFFKSPTEGSGRGVFIYKDGNNCISDVKNRKQHAWGIIKWTNGDEYAGKIKNNLPNGKGRLQFESHRKSYGGGFKDGKFHGKGSLIRLDKNGQPCGKYERGLFKDGKFVKYGKVT
jgi:hypothetical protein